MSRKLTDVATKLAAKSTPPPIVYIVDFENIPKTDVAALLDEANVRMVVLAANSTNTFTPQTLRTIEANPERIEVIIGRITRKEFVDKLVTAKIGEYAFRFPEAEIIVLANDKDYRGLADHLNDHWERAVPIRHVAPDAPSNRRKQSGGAKGGASPRGGGRSGKATVGQQAPDKTTSRKSAAKRPRERAETNPRSLDTKATKPKTTKGENASLQATNVKATNVKAAGGKKASSRASNQQRTASNVGPKASSKGRTSGKPTQSGTSERDQTEAVDLIPDAQVIADLLAKMPDGRRPKSSSSLLNAVRNYREAMGLRARPTTIIKHLEQAGLVAADAKPVTYALGR